MTMPQPDLTADPPPARGLAPAIITLARDIKLSHSLFALPFALLATFLAAGHAGRLPSLAQFALIVVCMIFARTVAMLANRLADADFDARNPRTAGRAIPAGRLSRRFVMVAAALCAAGFIAATGGFWLADDNVLPLVLSPFVLIWLAGYSFTKRFSWLCHLWLGSALAISPLAAAIAIAPGYLATAEPYLLAVMVMCWVAGFDVIYALADVEVDRVAGLFSMPANLGVGRALWISRLLHVAAAAALILLYSMSRQLHLPFAIGIAAVAGLLILEHTLILVDRDRNLNMAFFTVNGIISLLLGTLGIIDVVAAALSSAGGNLG